MILRALFLVTALASTLCFVQSAAAQTAMKLPAQATFDLSEFGAIDNPKQAQETFEKAVASLKQTGGILLVPSNAWKQIKAGPLQGLVRTPAPPEETKRWQTG